MDKANPKTMSIILGEKFPAQLSDADYNTPILRILSSESAMVIWHIESPTPGELQDFNHGKIKFGIRRYGKVMFFCVNQQPFAEGDCAFHASRFDFPRDMHIMHSTNDAGMPLYMVVVDEKNIVRAMRCVNLNKAVTDKLSDIFELQRTEDGLLADSQFRQTVINAYHDYPSAKSMMDSCEAFCNIKGRLVA